MTRRAKPARHRPRAHPAVPDDLAALVAYGPEVVAAARAALGDLAHGRVTGKLLGEPPTGKRSQIGKRVMTWS